MPINQKGASQFIVGVLILVLLIGGASSYFIRNRFSPALPDAVTHPTSRLPTSSVSIVAKSNEGGSNIYVNKTHKYTVEYPSDRSPQNETGDVETQNSVIFGCTNAEEGYCLPPSYISVNPNSTDPTTGGPIYNSLRLDTIAKIFALEVGKELDEIANKDVGGNWELQTGYKRLPDEVINGENFLVLENQKGYGGSDRRLFIIKDNRIYIIGGVYSTTEEFNKFKSIYSSFKFVN